MKTVILPQEVVENFYGSPLTNNSYQLIPIEVAEMASKLRQMLVDCSLNISITVSNWEESL